MVSLERFELSPLGPKPSTLPGYAIESFLGPVERIELPQADLEAAVLTIILHRNCLVAGEGVEPSTPAYETGKMPFLHPAIVW